MYLCFCLGDHVSLSLVLAQDKTDLKMDFETGPKCHPDKNMVHPQIELQIYQFIIKTIY